MGDLHRIRVFSSLTPLTFTDHAHIDDTFISKSFDIMKKLAVFTQKDFIAVVTDYAHITTQLEDTYVCIWEFLRRSIGLAFSTLKTTYNRDRLMIPVSGLLL